MSTIEIQDFLHSHSVFTFRGGNNCEGMLVARYNIQHAMLEYYFIPADRMKDYSKSHFNHDLNAHKRLGKQIDINSIARIELIN